MIEVVYGSGRIFLSSSTTKFAHSLACTDAEGTDSWKTDSKWGTRTKTGDSDVDLGRYGSRKRNLVIDSY